MARSFFIVRASEDPTALEFFPPKGSDELHEALKEAFPFESNLASRMRAATIEFLLQEQQADLTPVSTDSQYLPSPQSSFLSTMPSPAMPMAGPSIPVQTTSPAARRLSAATQPSQEALMDVWSLPNKPQAKVHTRRTMTAEEKKAYKQKRIIGACADCKKRRRKCEHNAAGGSSISPQKVGKHKKRTTTGSASVPKPEATADFSWSAPPFNFEAAFDASAMPVDVEASFDFAATDFSFSPDLNDDWQLFPDMPIANNPTFMDSWPSNYYDGSLYAPNASTSQQRVSSNSGAAGFLSQNSAILDSGDATGVIFSSESLGSGVPGHLTPASLSPMSRTQSAGEQPALGQATHNVSSTNNATASSSSYSTGAQIEQSRVSRDKPIQVPLASPDPSPTPAYSDNLLQSFVNDHNIDHNSDRIDPGCRVDSDSSHRTSHGFASDHTSTWLHTSCSGARVSEDVKHDGPAQFFDRGRLRNALPMQEEKSRIISTIEDREKSHAEASLLIRELLQTKASPRTGAPRSTTTSRKTVTTTTIASQPSTTSRLRFFSSDTQPGSKLQTQPDRASPGIKKSEGATEAKRQELAQCYYATTKEPNLLQTNLNVWQAPLCVVAYILYQLVAQSSNTLAMFATLLLGTVVLSLQLSSLSGTGSSKSTVANLQNWLHISSSLEDKTVILSGRKSSSLGIWTKSLVSHLGHRLVGVMI